MYTYKDFNNDIYQLCQRYFIKFQLLKEMILETTSQMETMKFLYENVPYFDQEKEKALLQDIADIRQKLAQNGGTLSQDPLQEIRSLRKSGDRIQAYTKCKDYLVANPNHEEANLTFGWIMYDFLKETENCPEKFTGNLRLLNKFTHISFFSKHNEAYTMLTKSILWSIRHMITKDPQNSSYASNAANMIYNELINFIGNTNNFIEHRLFLTSKEPSISRLLIKDLSAFLNESNYFHFMDIIGFNWFDSYDHKEPFGAKKILYDYSKKLLDEKSQESTEQRMLSFLQILEENIQQHPDYEWLPYYRIKILKKLGQHELAFHELCKFAFDYHKRDFWIWNLMSTLVEGDRQFHCICAALLCKGDPKLLVNLYYNSIPVLLANGKKEEAKYVIQLLIKICTNEKRKIPENVERLCSEPWFHTTCNLQDLSSLQKYADDATKLLYMHLPYTEAIVTYINTEKNAISINYLDGYSKKEGYFFSSTLEYTFEQYQPILIQMTPDKKHDSRLFVYSVKNGNKDTLSKFVSTFSGKFLKKSGKKNDHVYHYGFIRDGATSIYVNPDLVEKYHLEQYSTITCTTILLKNKKQNRMEWNILTIDHVENPDPNDYDVDPDDYDDVDLE